MDMMKIMDGNEHKKKWRFEQELKNQRDWGIITQAEYDTILFKSKADREIELKLELGVTGIINSLDCLVVPRQKRSIAVELEMIINGLTGFQAMLLEDSAILSEYLTVVRVVLLEGNWEPKIKAGLNNTNEEVSELRKSSFDWSHQASLPLDKMRFPDKPATPAERLICKLWDQLYISPSYYAQNRNLIKYCLMLRITHDILLQYNYRLSNTPYNSDYPELSIFKGGRPMSEAGRKVHTETIEDYRPPSEWKRISSRNKIEWARNWVKCRWRDPILN
ncbi:hypothetical protein ACFLX5_06440 [Chloroflexota bacterium]